MPDVSYDTGYPYFLRGKVTDANSADLLQGVFRAGDPLDRLRKPKDKIAHNIYFTEMGWGIQSEESGVTRRKNPVKLAKAAGNLR